MEDTLEARSTVIKNIDIFSQLHQSAIIDLAKKIKISAFMANDAIIKKGDHGNCMYVILEGEVRVHDEELIVAHLSKDHYFGEFSLLDDEPRSMSVTATKASILAAIFQDDFYQVLDANPSITRDVITTLISRLRDRTSQIIIQMQEREAVLEKLVEKRTKELMTQKEIVELKNKEILDSIHYAKKHQDAILPKTDIIRSCFNDSFVLYKQKDIVAGDFYWISSSEKNHIVVAADCTGHGVAGALMSILGMTLLDQIVNQEGTTQPSLILDKLHNSIISSLNQRQNDSSDGMDIAICRFDLQKNEIEYAGANRPLWLIRNNEVIISKADKMPIGGLQLGTRGNYSNIKIDLQKGDSIYTFSDGYADQFGGDQNKKFMTRKLRELLLEIHTKPFSDQKRILDEKFEAWKGNNEQIDDVLVIGIKI
ncbi:MAG: SpoIIE family protein phosphatase [Bacteroidia bacterium]|nr:SpoIIE family protein phosphatase [Bacteroidia bacterium]